MMAYPGEGYNMSNYGLKTYTPEQIKEMWRENSDREIKISKNHNATKIKKGQAISENAASVSYFNNDKEQKYLSAYDQTFCVVEGYNQKLKRDDFQHTQGLDIHQEEKGKLIPVLSNSIYGTRSSLETPVRDHVRVAVVRREFYRPRGPNLQPLL